MPATRPLASPAVIDAAETPVRNILHIATTSAASGDITPVTAISLTAVNTREVSSRSGSTAVVSSTRDTDSVPHRSQSGLSAFNVSALRSRLRQHRDRAANTAKSVSSRTSISSQPVLVRSYSGAATGPASLYGGRSDFPNSIYTTETGGPGDPGRHQELPNLEQTETALRRSSIDSRMTMQSRRSDPVPPLPPVSEFSFSHVLEAISPDIRDALDAISEICARSRLSLADEYGAHLPPLGEIRDAYGQTMGQLELRGGRNAGLFVRTTGLADSALSVVQEASSSSGSEGGRKSAYGSLRSVLSKGRRKKTPDTSAAPKDATVASGLSRSWAVRRGGKGAIVLVGRPMASKCVSTDLVLEVSHERVLEPLSPNLSLPPQEVHNTSWIPWIRQKTNTTSELDNGSDRVTAEALLKNILVPSGAPVEVTR